MTATAHESDKMYEGVPFDMPRVATPSFPDYRVDIRDFGAVSDGHTLCTDAFKAAIEHVNAHGGGTVVIPAGLWYTGPIELLSNVCLHSEYGALVLFTSDLDAYKIIDTSFEGLNTRRCQSPLYAYKAHNIAITGHGTFDGCGEDWRPVKKSKVTSKQWKELLKKSNITNEKGDIWYPSEASRQGAEACYDFNVPDNIGTDEQWESIKRWLRPTLLNFIACDTVLLANNHTGDYGAGGVKDTLDAFAKLNIRTVGAGMNAADAARPLRIKQNGLTVSVINAAEYEFGIAYDDVPGAYGIDPLQIAMDVKREKAECDLVIVTLHGGHEMYSYPTPRLRKLCRTMVDMGADAVFNCHTHCPLGYEVYNNVPIIYSPGNFYFPNRPTSLPCWYLGYLPKFFFDENGAFALELLPYLNYKEALTLLDEAQTEKFFAYLDELTSPIADEARLQKLFDAWCARSGLNGYFGQLFNRVIPESFQVREGVKKNLGLRNLFTCQSHHDLLRNTLLLMERYQLEEAKELIPLINAAQNPEWVKIAEN